MEVKSSLAVFLLKNLSDFMGFLPQNELLWLIYMENFCVSHKKPFMHLRFKTCKKKYILVAKKMVFTLEFLSSALLGASLHQEEGGETEKAKHWRSICKP